VKNMNRFFLIMLLSFNCGIVFSQTTYKQTRIPLDNQKGVPFSKISGFYDVDGFEIDSKGNFYFSAGENGTIAVFNGDKPIYRKSYSEFYYEQLYIFNNRLFVFNSYALGNRRYKNNLFELSLANETILKKRSIAGINWIDSYFFRDTRLIIDTSTVKNNNYLTTHLQYDLSGKFVKELRSNIYNLPFDTHDRIGQFLGKWNGNYLFWKWDDDHDLYKFSLYNSSGVCTDQKNISSKLFGKVFYEDRDENRKLRNGSIFILGRDGKYALVTQIPVKELFINK